MAAQAAAAAAQAAAAAVAQAQAQAVAAQAAAVAPPLYEYGLGGIAVAPPGLDGSYAGYGYGTYVYLQ